VEIADGMGSNQRDEQERWIDLGTATTEGLKSRKCQQKSIWKELWAGGQTCRNELEVFLELLESSCEATD
jgi:hypothetical protein